MKTKLFALWTVLTLGIALVGCKKNETPSYKGENKVVLNFKDKASGSAEEIQVGSGKTVEVIVSFTHRMEEQTTLSLNLTGAAAKYLSVSPAEQKIKVGDRQAHFTLQVQDESLIENAQVSISVKITPAKESYKNDQTLQLLILPKAIIQQLTVEQKALLSHYKSTYNLDISPLLGEWKCQGSYQQPGGSSNELFLEAKEVTYNDEVTNITISPQATKERPVIRMTNNALGLKGYFTTQFEGLTIKNTEYWYNEGIPYPIKITQQINWSPSSQESYDVALDIAIDPQTQKLQVLKSLSRHLQEQSDADRELYYGWESEAKEIVPFIFNFSPWARIIAEYKSGSNPDWKEMVQSGSINPYQILFHSSMAKDEWKSELDEVIVPFVEPQFDLDMSQLKITFQFSHDDATEQSGYTSIKGTCTKKQLN